MVPSLYKLYSVSVIYHLSVAEISGWYEALFPETLQRRYVFPFSPDSFKRVPEPQTATTRIGDVRRWHLNSLHCWRTGVASRDSLLPWELPCVSRGNSILKVAPRGGEFLTRIVPPCSVTIP